METIVFERAGPVGWLRLNRPEKLNAFTALMWRELGALGEELVADADLRALVVIGQGRAFSSGIDTSSFGAAGIADDDGVLAPRADSRRHDDPVVDAIMGLQESYTWLERAPYATIAAVRGYALGAGLQLALACDIRVVARGTRLGLLEHRYGIIPDLGGTQRLPRLVGRGRAKDLVFTARQIDAEEAGRIGLAEHVVDDEELDGAAEMLAATIAAQPPLAIRGAKHAIDASMSRPIDDGLRIEAEQQAPCLRSDDMKEAIAAFVDRRPPVYRGR